MVASAWRDGALETAKGLVAGARRKGVSDASSVDSEDPASLKWMGRAATAMHAVGNATLSISILRSHDDHQRHDRRLTERRQGEGEESEASHAGTAGENESDGVRKDWELGCIPTAVTHICCPEEA